MKTNADMRQLLEGLGSAPKCNEALYSLLSGGLSRVEQAWVFSEFSQRAKEAPAGIQSSPAELEWWTNELYIGDYLSDAAGGSTLFREGYAAVVALVQVLRKNQHLDGAQVILSVDVDSEYPSAVVRFYIPRRRRRNAELQPGSIRFGSTGN